MEKSELWGFVFVLGLFLSVLVIAALAKAIEVNMELQQERLSIQENLLNND